MASKRSRSQTVALENLIDQDIRSHRLCREGESILVGVSGGLDSMVLLHLMAQLAVKGRWKLVVAHFNHRLRGRASADDERFVRTTAKRLKLRVETAAGDVKKLAKEQGISIEMAARQCRHEFFARTARKLKIKKIALAHHADDQVELFFLRLLRGSGGEGLGGMKWKSHSPLDSNLEIIRPLLATTKITLQEYAAANKIAFREDVTNALLDYQRNRIRHEILPVLKKYQPALEETVGRSMQIVRADAEFVRAAAEGWLTSGGAAFADLSVAAQRRVIELQLRKLDVSPEFELVERLRLAHATSVSAGTDTTLVRDNDGTVRLHRPATTGFATSAVIVDVGSGGRLAFGGLKFSWRVSRLAGTSTLREAGRERFDAEKVGERITFRHWRQGDRFQPIGMPKPVKLQDLFTNLKVPREERHRRVIAVGEEGEIFWVEGLRIGEKFKLSPGTKRVFELLWNPHPGKNIPGNG